ncbi:MAG: hypothetical protein SFY68_10865 [Candidatus Sumerlaeia bacterium]|nr:hypothetical protein [Candidatus Sumerlaeia bacterium]
MTAPESIVTVRRMVFSLLRLMIRSLPVQLLIFGVFLLLLLYSIPDISRALFHEPIRFPTNVVRDRTMVANASPLLPVDQITGPRYEVTAYEKEFVYRFETDDPRKITPIWRGSSQRNFEYRDSRIVHLDETFPIGESISARVIGYSIRTKLQENPDEFNDMHYDSQLQLIEKSTLLSMIGEHLGENIDNHKLFGYNKINDKYIISIHFVMDFNNEKILPEFSHKTILSDAITGYRYDDSYSSFQLISAQQNPNKGIATACVQLDHSSANPHILWLEYNDDEFIERLCILPLPGEVTKIGDQIFSINRIIGYEGQKIIVKTITEDLEFSNRNQPNIPFDIPAPIKPYDHFIVQLDRSVFGIGLQAVYSKHGDLVYRNYGSLRTPMDEKSNSYVFQATLDELELLCFEPIPMPSRVGIFVPTLPGISEENRSVKDFLDSKINHTDMILDTNQLGEILQSTILLYHDSNRFAENKGSQLNTESLTMSRGEKTIRDISDRIMETESDIPVRIIDKQTGEQYVTRATRFRMIGMTKPQLYGFVFVLMNPEKYYRFFIVAFLLPWFSWMILQSLRLQYQLLRKGYRRFLLPLTFLAYMVAGRRIFKLPPFAQTATLPGVDGSSIWALVLLLARMKE